MKAQAIRIKDNFGEVHIQPPSGSFDPMQTMCMSLDDYQMQFKQTNETVTCEMCQINFDVLRDGIKLVKI